jgi:hypothetical protein
MYICVGLTRTSFVSPQQLMQAHGMYIVQVFFVHAVIVLRRRHVASHCSEQREFSCTKKRAYPTLVYVTGSKAQGNAIFIQSVFHMSWGRTTPTQSSHTIVPSLPRSYHNSYKRTTRFTLSPLK